MTPEELARQNIDRRLSQCGWAVLNHQAVNIFAQPDVAVRESALSRTLPEQGECFTVAQQRYVVNDAASSVMSTPAIHASVGDALESHQLNDGGR